MYTVAVRFQLLAEQVNTLTLDSLRVTLMITRNERTVFLNLNSTLKDFGV